MSVVFSNGPSHRGPNIHSTWRSGPTSNELKTCSYFCDQRVLPYFINEDPQQNQIPKRHHFLCEYENLITVYLITVYVFLYGNLMQIFMLIIITLPDDGWMTKQNIGGLEVQKSIINLM